MPTTIDHAARFVIEAMAQDRIRLEYEGILVPGDGIERREALARIIERDPSGALGDHLIPAGVWIEAVNCIPQLARIFDWYVIELIFSGGIPPGTQTWINVTGHTVKDEDFSDRFTEMMRRYSIAPDSIAIEVTEQAAGNGAERHLSTLHTKTGVAIVVDDFGAGYSNLLALLRLPLYAVKIDGKLVKAYQDPHVAAVIKAAALLGREWDVLLVAEWVEDLTMLKTLQSWDVTGFQGFAVR